MIIVLTHNGKMSADGGIRRGYQVDNRLFCLAARQMAS